MEFEKIRVLSKLPPQSGLLAQQLVSGYVTRVASEPIPSRAFKPNQHFRQLEPGAPPAFLTCSGRATPWLA